MAKAKKPKKKLWAVPGLESRVRELIESGALAKGSDSFCQVINGEFAEKFEADGLRLTPRGLEPRLPKLIWSTKALDALKKAIRTGLPLQQFATYYPHIPEKFLQAKAKFLTGLTDAKATAEFLAGMGRLSTADLPADAESFEFAENGYHKPFVVAAKAEWTASVLNGALIGIKHSRIIKENPARRALSDAQKRGDAVVVVANTLCMDLKKAAGPIKVYRAQVSGLRVKVEHLPVSYRDEAGRILKEKPLDEVVFMPMSARFLAFLDAWDKIVTRPDGTPEFTGPIVYPLGYYEEELINSAAYHEVRYIVIRKRQRLDAEVSFAKAQLTRAMDDAEDCAENSKEFKWLKRCSARLDALIQQQAMTIISNVSEQDMERHRLRMRALLVRKLEEVIPGCKVVSQGSAYVQIGDENVEFNIPGNAQVSDGTLSSYVGEYGAKVFRDQMSRTVVICHPHCLNSRAVGRDDYTDGQRDSSMVYTAPVCVDDVFLRGALKHSTKTVHQVSRMLKSEQFRPGVLVLRKIAGAPLTADAVPIPKLDSGNKEKAQGYFPYPGTKHIWTMVATDLHFGSRSREHVLDEQNERWLGVAEVSMEMMRREGLFAGDDNPVHIMTVNDDETQGNHFDTHKQPDPREMSFVDLEARTRRAKAEAEQLAKKGDSGGLLKLVMSLGRFSLAHRLIQGEDWAQPQMLEVFTRLIEPNLDFFDTLLSNTRRSKLHFRGLSEINGAEFDARDVGAISFGTGNHIERTIDRNLTEGVFYAFYLKALLSGRPRWRKDPSFLERHVRAPLEGNAYFGEGTVQAPGGYEWAINFSSSPARLSSWADPTGAVINNDRHRGDPFGHQKGRKALRTYGDKHFFSWCDTPYSVYAMCAAHTHTDRYGHHGFPPNNTGVLFIGLPAGGPDDGPVLFRPLRYDFLRDWMKNPKPFDWKKFLPNPV